MVAEAAHSLDYTSLATNVGIAIGFVVAAVLGIKKGLDTFKTKGEDAIKGHTANVAAAKLLENQTLNEWSESNCEVVRALQEHGRELVELRRAIYKHTDAMSELRHQVERVRDRMD